MLHVKGPLRPYKEKFARMHLFVVLSWATDKAWQCLSSLAKLGLCGKTFQCVDVFSTSACWLHSSQQLTSWLAEYPILWFWEFISNGFGWAKIKLLDCDVFCVGFVWLDCPPSWVVLCVVGWLMSHIFFTTRLLLHVCAQQNSSWNDKKCVFDFTQRQEIAQKLANF